MDRRDPSRAAAGPAAPVSTSPARPTLRRLEAVSRGRRAPGDSAQHREARTELSAWLVAGREAKGLSREQVAQITRIQARTIDRLEEGRFDELPADVFVRGFIRGYARCVGLSVEEALARYGSCGFAAAPVASAQAHALLDSMASLAPESGSVVPARPGASTVGKAPRILRAAEAGAGAEAGSAAAPGMPGPAVPGMVEVDVALARRELSVPVASGSLRDLPAVREAAPEPVDETPATSTAVLAAEVATSAAEAAEPGADGGKRRRRKKGEGGGAMRDSRGRFVRRTGAMPAVDVAALGLEAAAEVEATRRTVTELIEAVCAGTDARDAKAARDAVAANEPSAADAASAALLGEVDAAREAAVEAGEVAIDVATEAATEASIDVATEVAIDLADDGPAGEPTGDAAGAAIAARADELGADAQARTERGASSPAIEVVFAEGEAVTVAPVTVDPALVASESGRFGRIGRVTGSSVAIPPRTRGIHVAPTLVIDDDDPEDAERAREERQAQRKDADKGWRSFIPPALLDQQRGRQGGLTLAVIILLIVATLTLSYLMRRPSSAGDGITSRELPAERSAG
ncbi:MAG TPA: helix-turn-helix transcriptional regulator [Kofleriaceae bacterium]|nr:helix-turn-helix transcriptional regulator [Kofleriaceae bacterium]